jgi:UDP-glucose 4-epimerase
LGSRRENTTAPWLPQAKIVRTNWDNPTSIKRILEDVDSIVHCAAMNAASCQANPVAALEVNALNTAKLVEMAIQKGVKRFIYASTAHVYGNPLAGLLNEHSRPDSLHPYASSHRAGEDAVRAASQHGEIEGLVIRISNAYGPPAHEDADCWTLLINDLSRQAVTTRRIVLRTAGLQRRNFIPLTDVCRAINLLLFRSARDLAGDIFNLGSGWSPTVFDAACLVKERCAAVLGFHPEITRVTPQPSETAPELEYRSDNLHRIGYHPQSDHTGEIDSLLEYCSAHFS